MKRDDEKFQEIYFNRISIRDLIRLNSFIQIEFKLSRKFIDYGRYTKNFEYRI